MPVYDNSGYIDNWITSRIVPGIDSNICEWVPNTAVVDLDSLELNPESFRCYRINAAQRCAESMGTKPVLALSGGIDSQAMLQSFVEAGIDVSVATMVFEDNLNGHDVEFAERAAQRYNLDLVKINFNAFKFLQHELWTYAERYQCNSPQFACHNWFFEQLISRGYTGIAAGGHVWTPMNTGWWWGNNPSTQQNWYRFSVKNSFPVHGNFLASTWQLNTSLACCYDTEEEPTVVQNDPNRGQLAVDAVRYRYLLKVAAFKRFGFDVEPQQNKFTGFERIKERLIKSSGDWWIFERRFRHPLEQHWPSADPQLILESEFKAKLNQLYFQYSRSNC